MLCSQLRILFLHWRFVYVIQYNLCGNYDNLSGIISSAVMKSTFTVSFPIRYFQSILITESVIPMCYHNWLKSHLDTFDSAAQHYVAMLQEENENEVYDEMTLIISFN